MHAICKQTCHPFDCDKNSAIDPIPISTIAGIKYQSFRIVRNNRANLELTPCANYDDDDDAGSHPSSVSNQLCANIAHNPGLAINAIVIEQAITGVNAYYLRYFPAHAFPGRAGLTD